MSSVKRPSIKRTMPYGVGKLRVEVLTLRDQMAAALKRVQELEARLSAIEQSPHFDDYRAAQSRVEGMKRGNPGMLMWPT